MTITVNKMEKNWMMAVPLSIDEESHDQKYWLEMRERLLTNQCNRVFLCTIGKGCVIPVEHFRALIPKFMELGEFFQSAGIEPGIWLGHSIGHGKCSSADAKTFSAVVESDSSGNLTEEHGVFCPLDEAFQNYLCEVCAVLATSGLPLLMLDDDYRLGFHGSRFGCFCSRHTARLQAETGWNFSAAELAGKFHSDLEVRRRICENNAASLYELARKIGKAVHAVAPGMRIGLSTCAGLYTGDGIDPVTLMTSFNENGTRPFLRTGGAPYWNRCSDYPGVIVEYSRLQAAWLSGTDIEVFAEGDTFPHNTFVTPASSLRAFDEGLASAGFPGILSYQYSYGDHRTSDLSYDRSTRQNRPFHNALREFSPQAWHELGFESIVSHREFLYRKPDASHWDSFHNKIEALEILPRLGIPLAFGNRHEPVVLTGTGCNAYSNDEICAFLQRGAALDIIAAKELSDRSINVGLQTAEPLTAAPQWDESDTGIRSLLRCPCDSAIWKCRWTPGALIRQCSSFEGNMPGIAHLRTPENNRIVIFPWCLETAGAMNCTFLRQRQWQEAYAYLASRELPVTVNDHADIRLHIRQNENGNEIAVTVQNLSLDSFRLSGLTISPQWKLTAWLPFHGNKLSGIPDSGIAGYELSPMELCLLRLSHQSE